MASLRLRRSRQEALGAEDVRLRPNRLIVMGSPYVEMDFRVLRQVEATNLRPHTAWLRELSTLGVSCGS